MNILPFISFFLIIIAGFFIAIQSMGESACHRSLLLLGEFHAERLARNRIQRYLFETMKGTNSEVISKHPKERKQDREVSYHRAFKRLSEKHKVNIYSLLQTPNPESADLYSFSVQLLTALYSHCDFYNDRFPKAIFQCLLEAGKRALEPDNSLNIVQIMSSIFIGLDSHILYQVLRGTNYYNVEKREGIPPLLDFFTISSDKRHKPLYFPLLRKVYLHVAFGEKCSRAILAEEYNKREEKRKGSILTKAELCELLERIPQETPFHLDEIMLYSRPPIGRSDKSQVVGVDDRTHIQVRKNC